ncbi:AAA family ATPase [Bacillus salacetis]|uniref:AAA family ATPase n=1 Tax=Bacillus salacetis TaxID=2315464 RepID=UPI003BA09528
MKIKNIRLKNVKNFNEKTIDFSTVDGNNPSVIALLGDNGSGKSTILKAIVSALSLYNPSYGGAIFDKNDIRIGEHFYQIDLDLLLNDMERDQLNSEDHLNIQKNHTLKVGKVTYEDKECIDVFFVEDKDNKRFNTIKTKFSSNHFKGGYIFYFDPFRFLPNEELEGPNSLTMPKNPRENALTSSIVNNSSLNKKFLYIKQWLINLDFKRLKSPTPENEYIFRHVTEAFNTLFSPYIFERVSEKGQILFRNNDKVIEIDKLSEGFKNLFIIIGEIFFRLYIAADNNSLFFEEEAVILIDEIDCHIHPKWQVNIVPYLKKMFPNCQFIITTHSPFIVSELEKNEIIKLEGD